jgi:hypothetical protein
MLQPRHPWHRSHLRPKSTKANSLSPNPSAYATRRTSNSSPPNRVSSADGSRPTRIIYALRSRGRLVLKSVTSSPCRCAGAITDNCTRPAKRKIGGEPSRSMHWRSQQAFGSKVIPRLELKNRPLTQRQCDSFVGRCLGIGAKRTSPGNRLLLFAGVNSRRLVSAFGVKATLR